MPTVPFEHKRRETTAKLAALMLANAFIFQEQLSEIEKDVSPLRTVLAGRDFIDETVKHWDMIIREINYVPIFNVAKDILLSLPANLDTENSVRRLAFRSLEIVSRKAALRHDLMGRIYHLLLHEAKYLGTYYTSVPAATLLLKLALDIERWPEFQWSEDKALRKLRIADLACGTGTLLMAASQAITDNFIKFKTSNDERVDDVALRKLHQLIVEEVLYGFDVLPSAVHLTASTLALLAPETCFKKMSLYSLPIGKTQTGQIYLGSIDYISSDAIQTQLDLMSAAAGAKGVGREGKPSVAQLPTLDLCVMNPPFVRSVGGNLLFGSMPQEQRSQLQEELARRLRDNDLSASSTAGLGSVFTAVADRHVKEGGRLALVLPAAVTTGVAWSKTRSLINSSYVLEALVTSHDPFRWNFSENTDLSEVLIIARKKRRNKKSKIRETTQFINLWKNPSTSAHALAVVDVINRIGAAPLGGAKKINHGISEIVVGIEKYGEAIEVPWDDTKAKPWIGGAFAQTNILRAAWMLRDGFVYRPGQNKVHPLPMKPLAEFGSLGPDRRDIADGFTISRGRTGYPALIGHRSENIQTIEMTPNGWLSPRSVAAKNRPLRDVGLLWPRAGALMIAERSRLNTQRLLAVRMTRPGLSNVWWPIRLHSEEDQAEKILALWLNSTLGLLMSIAHRIPTEGPWVQFKKPNIESLPVIDLNALSKAQKKNLAAAYDALCCKQLNTISNMAKDEVRADIDRALSVVLQIPLLDNLRNELAKEPVISSRPLDYEAPPLMTDQLEFELIA